MVLQQFAKVQFYHTWKLFAPLSRVVTDKRSARTLDQLDLVISLWQFSSIRCIFFFFPFLSTISRSRNATITKEYDNFECFLSNCPRIRIIRGEVRGWETEREREKERGCFISILSSRVIKFARRTCWSRSWTGARNPTGRKHDSATQNVRSGEREKDEHRQLLKNALPIIPFLSPLNDRAN